MAVKSKFVQISKDIINIQANTEPTQAEDDNGAVHWFIVNRTVFSDTSSPVNSSRNVIRQKYKNIQVNVMSPRLAKQEMELC